MKDTRIFVPDGAKAIIDILEYRGYEVYLIGGCVRDSLLRKNPKEWDVCTNAIPAEVAYCSRLVNAVVSDVSEAFGVVHVLIDDVKYNITSYQMDTEHPNLGYMTQLERELSRRVFSVNAMAYYPETGLIDPFGGHNDLAMGVLRCIGNADTRLKENPVWILRALRLASTYHLTITSETAEAMHHNKELLRAVKPEQIRDELCKMLVGDNIRRILTEFEDIIEVIIPEIHSMVGFAQNNPWHNYDVWMHTVHTVAEAKPDPTLRMMALLHDIGKPHTYQEDENGVGHFLGHPAISAEISKDILTRLQFSNESERLILKVISAHDTRMEMSTRAVRRMLYRLGKEGFAAFLNLREADILAQSEEQMEQRLDKVANLRCIASKILAAQECFSIKDLAINGKDLMKLGIQPGPNMGVILRSLLEKVIENPEENERDILMGKAKKLAAESN